MRQLSLLTIALSLCAIDASRAAGPHCEAGKGYAAVDLSTPVTENFLRKIKNIGINTVIRYYDWEDETLPNKTLTLQELALIAKLDMSVAVVFQHNNDCLCTFVTDVHRGRDRSRRRGTVDARRSVELARAFSQPKGSAIYFGVDGVEAEFREMLRQTKAPHNDAHVRRFVEVYVRRYFEDASNIVKRAGYKMGVYGGGMVCDDLLTEGLADYCWLANATSWPGSQELEKTKRWVLKQHLPTRKKDCFGQEVDLNSTNGMIQDFGQWKPTP